MRVFVSEREINLNLIREEDTYVHLREENLIREEGKGNTEKEKERERKDMVSQEDNPSLMRTFRGHKGCISAVAFNPSLTQLVSSSKDSCLMLWNFKPQLRAFRFVGHKVQSTKESIRETCYQEMS